MRPDEIQGRYDEIKRCLAQADSAFARAGMVEDEGERLRLIEEAEHWLVRAERRLASLTGGAPGGIRPPSVAPENRSFGAARDPASPRRMPRA